jgi:hypothetical protein
MCVNVDDNKKRCLAALNSSRRFAGSADTARGATRFVVLARHATFCSKT